MSEDKTVLKDDLKAAENLLNKVNKLHTAPQVAQKILTVTKESDFNMREVADCIETDPALAAKMLRVVNSARYGLKREVTNIRQAASYLGQRSLRLITLTFGLVESLTKGQSGKLFLDYWRRAITMAIVASKLGEKIDDVSRDDAYTGGLLADVGMLIFAQCCKDDYAKLFENQQMIGSEMTQAERKKFGFGHPVLGSLLLKRWEISENLVSAVAMHDQDSIDDNSLQSIVRAGDLIADVMWVEKCPDVKKVKSLLESKFQLDTDGFINLVLECKEEISETAGIFGVNLGKSIDCEKLIEDARQSHDEASLDTALELDNLVTAFEDMSNGEVNARENVSSNLSER